LGYRIALAREARSRPEDNSLGPVKMARLLSVTGYVGSLSALEQAAMARLEIMSSEKVARSKFSA